MHDLGEETYKFQAKQLRELYLELVKDKDYKKKYHVYKIMYWNLNPAEKKEFNENYVKKLLQTPKEFLEKSDAKSAEECVKFFYALRTEIIPIDMKVLESHWKEIYLLKRT